MDGSLSASAASPHHRFLPAARTSMLTMARETRRLRVTTGDESKQEPADIEAAVDAVTTLTPEEAAQTVAWLANRLVDELVL